MDISVRNLQIFMLNKPVIVSQWSFPQPGLKEQLSNKHPLYILADVINWAMFEENFKKHYKEKNFKGIKK